MNIQDDLRKCEILIQRELAPQFHPPIERAFDLVVGRLSILKELYADALKALQQTSPKLGEPDEKEEIENKLRLVKNGYIGVDQAMETIFKIRVALRFAPLNLSIGRKVGSNG